MANRVTLDNIVTDVLSDQEKYTTHEYLRLLNIANRGLRQLTFDVLGEVKIAVLEVSTALKIAIPSDFIDYKFIGFINSKGRIVPLGMRKDIPIVGDTNTLPAVNNNTGFSQGGVFGYGGGQNENGYYTPMIDTENDTMTFTSVASGKWVYMENISNGMESTGETVIHPYAEEALIAYVHWKDVQSKRNISLSEKELRRRDFYNERRLTKSRLQAFTKEEAIQQSRKGFKQSPKI